MNITETMQNIYALWARHVPDDLEAGPLATKHVEKAKVEITPNLINELKRLKRLGLANQTCADRLGISRSTVTRLLAAIEAGKDMAAIIASASSRTRN